MSTLATDIGSRVNVIPTFSGVTANPGTQLDYDIRRFQEDRFALVRRRSVGQEIPYGQATAKAFSHATPIAVLKTEDGMNVPAKEELIAAARLEYGGSTLIESTIRFKPESESANIVARRAFAEIGSFATPTNMSRVTLVDVIDTIMATVTLLLDDSEVEEVWLFPRNGFMSLLLAEIPGVLPPFRFRYCTDVLGWQKNDPNLDPFRSLNLRGLSKYPEVYQTSVEDLKNDVMQRLSLLKERHTRPEEIETGLSRAMWSAQRELLRNPIRQRHQEAIQRERIQPLPDKWIRQISAEVSEESSMNQCQDEDKDERQEKKAFLPFTNSSHIASDYLRTVVESGGINVTEYKRLALHLLQVQEGMSVLDVGCGVGVDLPSLQAMVGLSGRVVGIDHNEDLVRQARAVVDVQGFHQCMVFQGDAEQLTFPNEEFDRVRADRAVQYFPHPHTSIKEMWRVLKPGGRAVIVEPDWLAMILYPSGPNAGDDNSGITTLHRWYGHHIPHATIGRQLPALFRNGNTGQWVDIMFEVVSYTLSGWDLADMILQLTQSILSCAEEAPEQADALHGWLRMCQDADSHGQFFAVVPLFFVSAQKPMLVSR